MTIRTTIALDEDVYRAVRSLAETSRRSLGSVLSDLARHGLRPPAPARRKSRNAFPMFAVSRDATPLTPDLVRAALADDPR
jgi:hypothetical protein